MTFSWLHKFKSALISTLPMVVIVLILHFSGLAQIENNSELLIFCICALFVAIGMGLFTIGTDMAMSPIGEYIGASITSQRKIGLMIFLFFLLGAFIVIAEPDLRVLVSQVPLGDPWLPFISNEWMVIVLIGIGFGVFMVIGIIRILFQKSLIIWLFVFYGLLFALALGINQVNPSFLPFAFDSGGASAGTITVPFILALGIGIATTRSGRKTDEDSFGLIAITSIGPVLVVMISSFFIDNIPFVFSVSEDTSFGATLGSSVLNVAIAILPITAFFFIYQAIAIRLPLKELIRIIAGLFYTYVGLVIFLTAVNLGFLPIGRVIGSKIADDGPGLIVVFGAIIGMSAVLLEPAVHVLVSQIENITEGTIRKGIVLGAIAIGAGLAMSFSMMRLILQISIIYFVIGGYLIALIMAFFVPKIYSAMAFDAGRITSGPMNSSFVLPFAVGAAITFYGGNGQDIMTYAFGVNALVTLMPVITIQALGLYANHQEMRRIKLAKARFIEQNDDQIIHLDEVNK
ncbi:MAG: DUF1538 domain-containing protein [Bacteroidia bacterium]|nr:DUF1538 domain-containing protein [Bacteroidia bacterium]